MSMPVCPRCRERFPSPERFCPNDGTVLVEDVDLARIGTTVGNYYLTEILGRGGMGTVYKGEHVYIRKKLAVKVLHSQFARYEGAVARFLREARAASSIQHPNIVDVTDFGRMPDGGVYFVMEYLNGTSLEDYIEKQGCIPLHRALNIVNQIALALAAAHEKNIVHRDLKPENIMLIAKPGRRNLVRTVNEEDGNARIVTEREQRYDFVKVLDFGIAKVLSGEDMDPDTVQGAIFGTPEYMSPEAARGENVDWRSDIYSVGVILFDMITGRPPFEADDTAVVLSMHISQPPPLPREVAPHREITNTCERLILKAMAKRPSDRYQSMDEMREDLQHCYGSVAYRRNAVSIPGAISVGRDARGRGLTEEIDEWVRSDESRMSLDQARVLAMSNGDEQPTIEESPVTIDDCDSLDRQAPDTVVELPRFTPENMSLDEVEILSDALDAALEDDADDP